MLRASLGAGAFVLVPGLACGNDDQEVFAGAVAEPEPTTTTAPTTTVPTTAEPPTTEVPTTEPPTAESITDSTSGDLAVSGEMVIAFTYTQAPGGKNERPYIAVWIEDAAGDLAATVSLWYQVDRRGDRWLDHLTRWFSADLDRVASGGLDDVATVSSATRAAGAYAVVWDGTVGGAPAISGDYFLCIEAVREDGPYSLIREPITLAGTLPETALPDTGELSAASVRIDA